MIDAWILVWLQIGSVVLWSFAMVACFVIVADVLSGFLLWGYRAYATLFIMLGLGGLSAWGALWLWP